jgi:hypothetical protein
VQWINAGWNNPSPRIGNPGPEDEPARSCLTPSLDASHCEMSAPWHANIELTEAVSRARGSATLSERKLANGGPFRPCRISTYEKAKPDKSSRIEAKVPGAPDTSRGDARRENRTQPAFVEHLDTNAQRAPLTPRARRPGQAHTG